MVNNLPNFLLVGAAKSGTTSLHNYLNEHPNIFLPKTKEPHFLCFCDLNRKDLIKELYPIPPDIIVNNLRDYEELFSAVKNEKAIGEASTAYLFFYDRVIKNLRKYFKDWQKIKICIILRNPIDAAYSYYLMYNNQLREKLSFEESLKEEKERLSNGYLTLCITTRFFYFQQVKAFKENFDNVWVSLYDDLRDDPVNLIKGLYTFLDVTDSYVPDITKKENVFLRARKGILYLPSKMLLGVYFSRKGLIRYFYRMIFQEKVRKDVTYSLTKLLFSNEKPPMNPHTREHLKKMYCEDILKLQDLLGRDLSAWLR